MKLKNYTVVFCIVLQGKTPYDLAVSSQNKPCIEMITVEMKKRSPQGIWDTITRNPVRKGVGRGVGTKSIPVTKTKVKKEVYFIN